MNSIKLAHTAGLDIAKLNFDGELMNAASERPLARTHMPNQRATFPAFETWLLEHGAKPESTLICMESTGRYGQDLLEWLQERSWQVALVNPSRIKAHAKSMGLRSKTDRVDAHCIAHFAATHQPPVWVPCDPKIGELRWLLGRRGQLQKMIDQESNAREATREQTRAARITRVLEMLELEQKAIEKDIAELIQSHPALNTMAQNLETIPGIGKGTSPVMIQVTNSRRFESARQVAAHVGLSVSHHQSGKMSAPARLSKMGDPMVRKQLWWPANGAKRHPDFAPWVKQLEARGLTSKQIICAVMRKLVHIAFGVIKSGKPYDRKLAFPSVFA